MLHPVILNMRQRTKREEITTICPADRGNRASTSARSAITRAQSAVTRMRSAVVAVTVIALVAMILPAPVHSQTVRPGEPIEQTLRRLVPGLTAEEIEEIRTEDYIRFHTEDQPLTFRYMPDTSISERVRRSFDHVDPNVVNEVLYLLPRPERDSEGRPFPDDDALLLELYNTFRAVSRLSGVTYISGRTDGPRVLFDNVHRIETLRRRQPLPDPVVTRIPQEDTFLLQLDDSNFGTSYFEAMYIGGDDAVSMGMTNARALTYVVPVIRAERVRFQLVAIPLEDHLLLYGAVGLEAGGFLRRVVHLPGSFRRRIEALADWFIGEVY